MELKRKTAENPLLEARAEALKSAESQSLRPLGKCWGMDVFTWVNPSVYELAATISSFPFPVFFVTPSDVLVAFSLFDSDALKSIQWIGQYDSLIAHLDEEISAEILNYSISESLVETIELLRQNQSDRHVVLFVASGNEWKTKLDIFEEFVQTAKQL